MANVFLLSAGPQTIHGQLELDYLTRAAQDDRFGIHRMVENPDAADLILFAEREYAAGPFLEDVRKHPLVRAHRDRCFVFNPRYKNIPLLPGVYAGVSRSYYDQRRMRASHYPEVIENDSFYYRPLPNDPSFLYSFVGMSWTAPIRKEIAQLSHPRGYIRDTTSGGVTIRKTEPLGSTERDYMQAYAEITHDSQFVLCPRGTGPSTLRLFESMMMGRAPVIISDEWVAPEGPEWPSFSFQVAENEVASIPDLLAENEHRAVRMGQQAREAWDDWFSPCVTFHRVVEWCLSIQTSRTLPESVLYPMGYLPFFKPNYVIGQLRQSLSQFRSKLL
jgi:hypothetical protein